MPNICELRIKDFNNRDESKRHILPLHARYYYSYFLFFFSLLAVRFETVVEISVDNTALLGVSQDLSFTCLKEDRPELLQRLPLRVLAKRQHVYQRVKRTDSHLDIRVTACIGRMKNARSALNIDSKQKLMELFSIQFGLTQWRTSLLVLVWISPRTSCNRYTAISTSY